MSKGSFSVVGEPFITDSNFSYHSLNSREIRTHINLFRKICDKLRFRKRLEVPLTEKEAIERYISLVGKVVPKEHSSFFERLHITLDHSPRLLSVPEDFLDILNHKMSDIEFSALIVSAIFIDCCNYLILDFKNRTCQIDPEILKGKQCNTEEEFWEDREQLEKDLKEFDLLGHDGIIQRMKDRQEERQKNHLDNKNPLI